MVSNTKVSSPASHAKGFWEYEVGSIKPLRFGGYPSPSYAFWLEAYKKEFPGPGLWVGICIFITHQNLSTNNEQALH